MRYQELIEYAMKIPLNLDKDFFVGVNPGPDEFATRLSRSQFGVVKFIIIDDKLYIWGEDVWHIKVAAGLGIGRSDGKLRLTGYFTETGYYLNRGMARRENPKALLNHPRVLRMLNGKTLEELDQIP